MKSVAVLVVLLAIPAVQGLPAPALPASLGCDRVPACAWSDDFETYPAGSTAASGGWAKGLGGQAVVTGERSCTGSQSYKLTAYPYWALSAHRAVSVGPAEAAFVSTCVVVDVIPSGGNAHFGFKQGMGASSPWVWTMTLARNGDIVMQTSPTTVEVIGRWQSGAEYELGFALLPPTPTAPGFVVAWKDGEVALAKPVLPAAVRPIGSAALGMHVESFVRTGGRAYYDDVRTGALDVAALPVVLPF